MNMKSTHLEDWLLPKLRMVDTQYFSTAGDVHMVPQKKKKRNTSASPMGSCCFKAASPSLKFSISASKYSIFLPTPVEYSLQLASLSGWLLPNTVATFAEIIFNTPSCWDSGRPWNILHKNSNECSSILNNNSLTSRLHAEVGGENHKESGFQWVP